MVSPHVAVVCLSILYHLPAGFVSPSLCLQRIAAPSISDHQNDLMYLSLIVLELIQFVVMCLQRLGRKPATVPKDPIENQPLLQVLGRTKCIYMHNIAQYHIICHVKLVLIEMIAESNQWLRCGFDMSDSAEWWTMAPKILKVCTWRGVRKTCFSGRISVQYKLS